MPPPAPLSRKLNVRNGKPSDPYSTCESGVGLRFSALHFVRALLIEDGRQNSRKMCILDTFMRGCQAGLPQLNGQPVGGVLERALVREALLTSGSRSGESTTTRSTAQLAWAPTPEEYATRIGLESACGSSRAGRYPEP